MEGPVGGDHPRQHCGGTRAEPCGDGHRTIDLEVRTGELQSFEMHSCFHRLHHKVRAVAGHTFTILAEVSNLDMAVTARGDLDVQREVDRQRGTVHRATETPNRRRYGNTDRPRCCKGAPPSR